MAIENLAAQDFIILSLVNPLQNVQKSCHSNLTNNPISNNINSHTNNHNNNISSHSNPIHNNISAINLL